VLPPERPALVAIIAAVMDINSLLIPVLLLVPTVSSVLRITVRFALKELLMVIPAVLASPVTTCLELILPPLADFVLLPLHLAPLVLALRELSRILVSLLRFMALSLVPSPALPLPTLLPSHKWFKVLSRPLQDRLFLAITVTNWLLPHPPPPVSVNNALPPLPLLPTVPPVLELLLLPLTFALLVTPLPTPFKVLETSSAPPMLTA